jgi:hypothetical protein
MSTKRKRLRKQIDAEANKLIDKVYGEYIENVVATLGKPEIRRKLREIFREHLFFQIEVEGAADLAELDSILDKMERLLKRRIQDLHRVLETEAQLRQAEYTAAIATQKLQFLELLQWREAMRDGMRDRYRALSEELSKDGIDIPDFDSLNWGIAEAPKKSIGKVNKYFLKADKKLITDPFAKFRQWRISRKQLIRLPWLRKKDWSCRKNIFYPL